METLTGILSNSSYLGSAFQVVLDVVILVMLAVLLMGKKHRASKADETVLESFEKIIKETAAISREFETNLEQRQQLIQQITGRLDQHIQEGRDLCARLERLNHTSADNLAALTAAAPVQAQTTILQNGKTDHQKVLFLANKGLSPSEIAKSLRRPLGEIELILSLQKIAS